MTIRKEDNYKMLIESIMSYLKNMESIEELVEFMCLLKDSEEEEEEDNNKDNNNRLGADLVTIYISLCI